MPEPPAGPSPATIQRIQGVQARARTKAVAHSALPGGAAQVGAARKAVTEPEAEAVAKAQAALMAQVKAAPSPEIVKLCERIREVIRKKRPPDEDALAAAKPEGRSRQRRQPTQRHRQQRDQEGPGQLHPVTDAPSAGSPAKGERPPAPARHRRHRAGRRHSAPLRTPSPPATSPWTRTPRSNKKAQDAGMDTRRPTS